jgi:ParB family chromosome partitioning protein
MSKILDRSKLGRGLDSLLGEVVEVNEGEKILQLPPEEIYPNTLQPRENFDHGMLNGLVESIKIHGILQPVVVRWTGNRYELIAGERRWRAAKQAGLVTVPAVLRNVDGGKALELALIENIQREDLNPIEKAKAFVNLMTNFGLTQEGVAECVGMDRSSVANIIRLLELPPDIQEYVSRGTVSVGHARALLSLRNEEGQGRLCERIIKEGLSVRDVEAIVSNSVEAQSQRQKTAKGTHIQHLEDRLRETLGTMVTITERNGKGKIVINFKGLDQFEQIMEHIR